jgi:two-component system response regulator YesN
MTILISDDSTILTGRLLQLIEEIPNLDVVGTATNTQEARNKVDKLQPEFVITDIKMPGGGGLELLEYIKTNYPKIVVCIYTNYPYVQYEKKAKELGAEYFIHKTTDSDKLYETLLLAAGN